MLIKDCEKERSLKVIKKKLWQRVNRLYLMLAIDGRKIMTIAHIFEWEKIKIKIIFEEISNSITILSGDDFWSGIIAAIGGELKGEKFK